jgi:hypothetical protein
MLDHEILRRLLQFREGCNTDQGHMYIDSISLTLVNLVRNNALASKRVLRVYFVYIFVLGLASIFLILFDNVFRLFRGKKGLRLKSCGDWLVSFGKSHEEVLERVPELYPMVEHQTISVSTYGNSDFVYVDEIHRITSVWQIFIKQLTALWKIRSSINLFFSFFPLKMGFADLKEFAKSYFLSVRFRVWAENFSKGGNPKKIWFGNDTCYRAYWLMKSISSATSITVQHGIIENKLMYFCRTDEFYCWDEISGSLLWKNPLTLYKTVGYPKQKMNFSQIENPRKGGCLIISTKLGSQQAGMDVLNLIHALEVRGSNVQFKGHPLEDKQTVSLLKDYIFDGTWDGFDHYFVIGSSMAIDLNVAGIAVVPILLQKGSAFGDYYDAKTCTEFTEAIEHTSDSLSQFLDREKRLIKLGVFQSEKVSLGF